MNSMSNLYKKAMRRIEVPPDLLEKTYAGMRNAKPPARPRTPVYFAAALAACLLLTFISLPLIRNIMQSDFILTPLQSGELAMEVKVSGGYISFDEIPLSLSTEPNFGILDMEKQAWAIDRYIEFLGTDPRPSSLPGGFTLIVEEAAVYIIGSGDVHADELSLRYERDGGGWLELYISAGRLPAHALPDTVPNSDISGVKFFAGYADPNEFRAQFINEGIGYCVLGGGISQEEFIRFIYAFFK